MEEVHLISLGGNSPPDMQMRSGGKLHISHSFYSFLLESCGFFLSFSSSPSYFHSLGLSLSFTLFFFFVSIIYFPLHVSLSLVLCLPLCIFPSFSPLLKSFHPEVPNYLMKLLNLKVCHLSHGYFHHRSACCPARICRHGGSKKAIYSNSHVCIWGSDVLFFLMSCLWSDVMFCCCLQMTSRCAFMRMTRRESSGRHLGISLRPTCTDR